MREPIITEALIARFSKACGFAPTCGMSELGLLIRLSRDLGVEPDMMALIELGARLARFADAEDLEAAARRIRDRATGDDGALIVVAALEGRAERFFALAGVSQARWEEARNG